MLDLMNTAYHQRPLGFALVEVTRLLRGRIDRALDGAGLGLTAGEARVLAYVDEFHGQRQTALADRMGVEPMTLCGYLDRLQSRGLVTRAPDPADRRAKIVTLAEDAASIVDEIRRIMAAVREEATAGLAPEDLAATRRALDMMRGNLSAPVEVPA